VRWLVLEGPSRFFRLTKSLHNMLHGAATRRRLGISDHEFFQRVSRAAATDTIDVVAAGDVVVLHDPQTAGLVGPLKRTGAVVVWRCHVGSDEPSDPTEAAWRFLLPYLEEADALVFSRREFVPPALGGERVRIIHPAIDPCSAKNQPLAHEVSQAILHVCGLAEASGPRRIGRVPLLTGGHTELRRRCRVVREGPLPRLGSDRLVVAVARWDRLKDPIDIMQSFADHVREPRARLIVAGPAVEAIADDPEGRRMLGEARSAWRRLPARQRRRIDLASLPMADLDENALIVNALQRQAAVVVKKSLQEGFGLGLTEAMWKAPPVIATRVGGHRDQLDQRRTGVLVDDPRDLRAFGTAVREVLRDDAEALDLALAGRDSVRARFLADRSFIAWADVAVDVLGRMRLP
jgi:trehalose synthase